MEGLFTITIQQGQDTIFKPCPYNLTYPASNVLRTTNFNYYTVIQGFFLTTEPFVYFRYTGLCPLTGFSLQYGIRQCVLFHKDKFQFIALFV